MAEPIKTKILIADDEQVIATTLAMILKQSGFDAQAVYSGEQAIEVAQSFQPDLFISDVVMGAMNGIEAAIEIQRTLPSCKVLLFSGQAATVDLLERAGAEGHSFALLAKPIHPGDLVARLEKERISSHF